mmetsp:Transcript_26751/g.68780  ORF Transcript_26751/g.68780 Transcript_26751/m.68780 type:complete len:249 (-) Transcript_26751:4631-5377(-)
MDRPAYRKQWMSPSEEKWLLTDEELERHPSIVDGFSPEVCKQEFVANLRRISDVAVRLGSGGRQHVSMARVFFWRFFSRRSLKDYEAKHVASACLILAGKVLERGGRRMREHYFSSFELQDDNTNIDGVYAQNNGEKALAPILSRQERRKLEKSALTPGKKGRLVSFYTRTCDASENHARLRRIEDNEDSMVLTDKDKEDSRKLAAEVIRAICRHLPRSGNAESERRANDKVRSYFFGPFSSFAVPLL